MQITYDSAKNQRNIAARQLSFDRAADFDFNTAIIIEDSRKDYREKRHIAYGFLDERLHVLVFAEADNGIRVISFRKANKREVRKYEQFR